LAHNGVVWLTDFKPGEKQTKGTHTRSSAVRISTSHIVIVYEVQKAGCTQKKCDKYIPNFYDRTEYMVIDNNGKIVQEATTIPMEAGVRRQGPMVALNGTAVFYYGVATIKVNRVRRGNKDDRNYYATGKLRRVQLGCAACGGAFRSPANQAKENLEQAKQGFDTAQRNAKATKDAHDAAGCTLSPGTDVCKDLLAKSKQADTAVADAKKEVADAEKEKELANGKANNGNDDDDDAGGVSGAVVVGIIVASVVVAAALVVVYLVLEKRPKEQGRKLKHGNPQITINSAYSPRTSMGGAGGLTGHTAYTDNKPDNGFSFVQGHTASLGNDDIC